MKLTHTELPFEIDSKRFYAPGFVLEGECPNCHKAFSRDFAKWYLSYPKANANTKVTCYCDSCEHEWDVLIYLTLSLALVE